jgi:hypothetical protein
VVVQRWPIGGVSCQTGKREDLLTVKRGKIVEVDVVADPARLRELALAVLDD